MTGENFEHSNTGRELDLTFLVYQSSVQLHKIHCLCQADMFHSHFILVTDLKSALDVKAPVSKK